MYIANLSNCWELFIRRQSATKPGYLSRKVQRLVYIDVGLSSPKWEAPYTEGDDIVWPV